MRYARTPDTIAILSSMTACGAIFAAGQFLPESVAAIVPLWAGVVWALVLAVFSGISLAGVMWPNQLAGWQLELVGRFGVVGTTGGYAVAIAIQAQSFGAALAVALFGSISVSSAWRVYQLLRSFQEFQEAIDRLNKGEGGS